MTPSSSTPLRISVVVATRDRPKELRACLDSIRQNTLPPSEIVVVDSASSQPEHVSQVAAAAGAHLLRTDVPGAARAHNLGITAARGDIVAFTDDDALVDPSWILALVDAFGDRDVAAAVGPVFTSGSDPPTLLSPPGGFDPARESARFSRAHPGWFDHTALGAIGLGANLAARRSTFDRYGYFREALGVGAPIAGDDSYFLLRLVVLGGLVVNQPRARVYHPPQSVDRHRELEASTIAYVLYVLATLPDVRVAILKRIGRHLLGRRPARDTSSRLPGAPPWILRSLRAAPAQLLAAWRLDQRQASADRAQPRCRIQLT